MLQLRKLWKLLMIQSLTKEPSGSFSQMMEVCHRQQKEEQERKLLVSSETWHLLHPKRLSNGSLPRPVARLRKSVFLWDRTADQEAFAMLSS